MEPEKAIASSLYAGNPPKDHQKRKDNSSNKSNNNNNHDLAGTPQGTLHSVFI